MLNITFYPTVCVRVCLCVCVCVCVCVYIIFSGRYINEYCLIARYNDASNNVCSLSVLIYTIAGYVNTSLAYRLYYKTVLLAQYVIKLLRSMYAVIGLCCRDVSSSVWFPEYCPVCIIA